MEQVLKIKKKITNKGNADLVMKLLFIDEIKSIKQNDTIAYNKCF